MCIPKIDQYILDTETSIASDIKLVNSKLLEWMYKTSFFP